MERLLVDFRVLVQDGDTKKKIPRENMIAALNNISNQSDMEVYIMADISDEANLEEERQLIDKWLNEYLPVPQENRKIDFISVYWDERVNGFSDNNTHYLEGHKNLLLTINGENIKTITKETLVNTLPLLNYDLSASVLTTNILGSVRKNLREEYQKIANIIGKMETEKKIPISDRLTGFKNGYYYVLVEKRNQAVEKFYSLKTIEPTQNQGVAANYQNNNSQYTEDELTIARGTDLVNLLEYLGYSVERKGNHYSTKEMNSLMVYNRNTFTRWSNQEQAGDPIRFLMVIHGMSFKESVEYLLNYNGVSREMPIQEIKNKVVEAKKVSENKLPAEKGEFILPDKNANMARVFAYLIKTRDISMNTVQFFVRKGLIYESAEKHNAVFLSKDKDGVTRHAFMRGTNQSFPFKGDVVNNDKNYGFNVINKESDTLYVMEAAIDVMSFCDMYGVKDNYLALGMLNDAPLERLLQDYPHIKHIKIGLDDDKHANKATIKIIEKYDSEEWRDRVSSIEDIRPLETFRKYSVKDWNELSHQLKELQRTEQSNCKKNKTM